MNMPATSKHGAKKEKSNAAGMLRVFASLSCGGAIFKAMITPCCVSKMKVQCACAGGSITMKKIQKLVRSFLAEIAIYAVLVTGYFFLVMHVLGGWLAALFKADRPLYAIAALLLIIAQGFLLELFTTRLLIMVRSKTE